jgi:hypothetical protein
MVKDQMPIQLVAYSPHLKSVKDGYKVVVPLGDNLGQAMAVAAEKAGYEVTVDKADGLWLLKEK